MLDNEPQGGERDGVTTPSVDAAESTAPVRRTRAPRKKATPAAAPAAEAPGTEPGAAEEATAATEAVAPVRRRRKAAAPAAAPAVTEPAAEAPIAEDPAAVAESLLSDAEPVAPVKAVRSRRKKAVPPAAAPEPVVEEPVATAPVVEEPAVEEPVVEEPVAEEPAPLIGVLPLDNDLVEEAPAPRTRSRKAAALPPAVLFMPPEPEAVPAPTTRRTRRGAAAVPVAEPVAEEIEADEPLADELAAEVEPVEAPRRATRSRRRRGAAADEPEAAEVVEQPVLEEIDETADDIEDGAEDELDEDGNSRRRRRRGRRGRGRGKGPLDDGDDLDGEGEAGPESSAEAPAEAEDEEDAEDGDGDGDGVTRRRRRRRRKGAGDSETGGVEDGVHTVVRVREPRTRERSDEVQGVSGSTRLEAKRQRRRDGREQRRTRPPILSESEFLARREAVDRVMVVRQKPDRTQIAVLEDGVLVEHYVSRTTSGTMVGNVYLGKVQNVLPSMEAAFVDVGRGRNAVLYAGEVNWDATGLEGRARSIEQALRSGDSVLVQVTKDPIGHKGARLSSHIALSGRHLVYVPNGNASGISRKLPDNERKRLRDILKKLVPDGAGVIVRTAAEGASEDELARDVKRLQAQWDDIQARAAEGHAPAALSEEPDLVIRVVRDLFNEDFREVVIQGEQAYGEVEEYLDSVSPELLDRLHRYTGVGDIFADKRIDEQILKGLDRKVFLPSGGHLVIDRTEAMTVVDVNTGKYTGAGGNLEETVTRNNLEAAEEVVRQLRLRDIGGIVVIDFIDMVLESNRELVLRRLTECLGRDRTKHQVTEITSLGLVQMTRKRIGAGLLEAFTETCDHCKGRGLIIHTEPVAEKRVPGAATQVKAVAAAVRTETPAAGPATKSRRRRGGGEPAVAESALAGSSLDEVAPVETSPAHVSPAQSGSSRTEAAPIEAVQAEAGQSETGQSEAGRSRSSRSRSGRSGSSQNGSQPAGRADEPAVAQDRTTEDPAAETAGLPAGSGVPAAGSGIVARTLPAVTAAADDEYDISGYDLSRYESSTDSADSTDSTAFPAEPLQLTGSDDPDAAEDDDEETDDDEPVGAGAGGRRRSRRGGTRRRTRP